MVALIAFGLPFLDHQLPDTRLVAAGVPYRIGGGVSINPAGGARVDLTRTRPSSDRGTALFIVRGVRIVVVVVPYRGSLDGAATRLRQKIVRAGDAELSGSDSATRTGQDVVGRQGRYAGSDRVGSYAVFVDAAHSAEFTASGSDTDLAKLGPELDAMTHSLTFGSGP